MPIQRLGGGWFVRTRTLAQGCAYLVGDFVSEA